MTVQELKERYPDTHFIRTKSYIEKPDAGLMRKEFIPDADSPEFPEITPGKTKICPLSVTSFPSVLRRMTAMEAGAWAISKCFQQGWPRDKDNIECCLSNLEMEF